MFANSNKIKALIVNANLSESGRNLELLLPSEINVQIGSLLIVSGVYLNVISKCSTFIMVNVRNEDILNSNLSDAMSFDNLIVEIPLTKYLSNRFSFKNEICCITPIEIIKSTFECWITFECPMLISASLTIGAIVNINGLILTIQFTDETTFAVIFYQNASDIKDFKLWHVGRSLNLNLLHISNSLRDMV
ncbi:MAG: hypothetical protein ACTS6G_04010 [Candidatus Hodgkinia cicadicola]